MDNRQALAKKKRKKKTNMNQLSINPTAGRKRIFISQNLYPDLMTSDYREEYTLSESECCHYWNMGLHCDETFCQFYHACCFISCRTIFHRSHRAIQHTGVSRCSKWIDSLEGRNIVHPIPLVYDSRSSEEDTLEAGKKYNVKPPSLNAELFDSLLKKTYIDENTRDRLVRGWREGFDLGSNLPVENNMVKSPKLDETQKTVLRDGLETEVRLKRMIGPLDKPTKEEKWFKTSMYRLIS